MARRSRRRRLRAGAARRRPARRVQPDRAIPTPGCRRAGRYVRRIRARADETVPRAQAVGDDRPHADAPASPPRSRARTRSRLSWRRWSSANPKLELAAAPETSIVAFRARPAGCPGARLDELNRALPEAVQARGRAFVTGTVFGDRETLRACILHPDTSSEHLATLVAEVVATARTLVAAEQRGPRSKAAVGRARRSALDARRSCSRRRLASAF